LRGTKSLGQSFVTLPHARAREGGSLSFDEYLARGRFPINYFRYTDRSGKKSSWIVILRYENLTAELSEVFSQLNIPFDGTLGVHGKIGISN
jgi:hypothetical protein